VTEYLRPTTVAEAATARAAHPDWMVLAGGTDLMVNATHREAPVGIIDLWDCSELRGIVRTPDNTIRIGAGTPWLDVIRNADVAKDLPILAAAAREIGALQIQARGTIGGNIVTSSPVGDSLPVLLALDASLELVSQCDKRTVAYRDFCTSYRMTLLAGDEIVSAVDIPVPAAGTRLFWRKVGTRAAQSISKVMAAAAIHVENGTITWARFGLGAVAATPIRAIAAETAAAGRPPDAATARAVADALAGEIKPIDDVRSAADYRLEVAQSLLMRFVVNAGRP
jgi:xanthine dehydrogenase small subunit